MWAGGEQTSSSFWAGEWEGKGCTSQQGVLLPWGSWRPWGPRNLERPLHGYHSSGPCAFPVTPGAIWSWPELPGRLLAGLGGGDYESALGKKGSPHLTHQVSAAAITWSSGGEGRGQ